MEDLLFNILYGFRNLKFKHVLLSAMNTQDENFHITSDLTDSLD